MKLNSCLKPMRGIAFCGQYHHRQLYAAGNAGAYRAVHENTPVELFIANTEEVIKAVLEFRADMGLIEGSAIPGTDYRAVAGR